MVVLVAIDVVVVASAAAGGVLTSYGIGQINFFHRSHKVS